MQSFDLSFRRRPQRRCRICIGAGALDALVDDLERERLAGVVAVVADSNVAPLHARPLAVRLSGRGMRVLELNFAAGESSKIPETALQIASELLAAGAGRDTLVVGVGGGVTGDLAGFVASIWHRGVPVVQVPTSLLAMTDAAIGGKTAVNLARGKNLIGTFHQPWRIYADVGLLATLPEREYTGGFAEVVKTAAIADPVFFRWLESNVSALVSRDARALERTVLRCIEIKGRVVRGDEREDGRRAMLNFGHTVAHALESVTGYRVPHGEAVAAGIAIEARLAHDVTGFPAAHVRRIESLLRAFGLPWRLPVGTTADDLIVATRLDKKVREGLVRYALPLRLGRMPAGVAVTVPVEDDLVRRVLAEAAQADED